MNEGYIVYKCLKCNRIFILMTSDVTYSEEESKYLTCPYHGKHKDIVVVGKHENVKQCMKHDSYVKAKGIIIQRGWGNG